jgi:hypothetical protein
MRGQQKVAIIERRKTVRHDPIEMQKAAARLRHLGLVELQEFAVQPEIDTRAAVAAFGLRDLIGMMNRDMVDPAAVSVEMGRGLSRLAYRMLRHSEQISGRARSAMDFFPNAPRGASLPAE